jgi:hypothetical protein
VDHHYAPRRCAAGFWIESGIGTNTRCKAKLCLLKGFFLDQTGSVYSPFKVIF